jgi:hypothetical protein
MTEVRELIDMELDAVSGGDFNIGNIVVQPNIATQIGVAVGGPGIFGNGGSASVTQLLGQLNASSIR